LPGQSSIGISQRISIVQFNGLVEMLDRFLQFILNEGLNALVEASFRFDGIGHAEVLKMLNSRCTGVALGRGIGRRIVLELSV